ncbi:MAG: phosphotransferase [Lachnospiraceae bacterium]|nr:phosphotransferase [Lachnospiraceae bacterium]
MYNKINQLMIKLNLGEITDNPQSITGGLMHQMYRVETETGIYAVKVLNEEVMSRPVAYRNMVNSEKIAAGFREILPVVAAMEFEGAQIQEVSGTYYMLFPWVEGTSVFPPDIDEIHCEMIGEILGKMHTANLSVEGIEPEQVEAEMYDWDSFAKAVEEKRISMLPCRKEPMENLCWTAEFGKALADIKKWNKAVCEATDDLNQFRVLSHRDLDPKNVLWNEGEPLLIDWEAAGFVNPYQELLEIINYWADDGAGGLYKAHFDALIHAYQKHMQLVDVNWDAVFDGSYAGMLGWLEYNVKRALGRLSEVEKDRKEGANQVASTVRALYDYQEKVKVMKTWLNIPR